MKVKTAHDFQACVAGAQGGGLARTAYFDGMVLSESDMLREQSYWRTKRKLTNRALGQGVVWGLGTQWDARTRSFTLSPGYGLSCCGDDLVVECPATVTEAALVDPCSEDFRRLLAHAADKLDPCGCELQADGPVDACLLLEYVECPEDPRASFEDACGGQAEGCRYGAVRETTRLRLVPPPPPEPPGAIESFCRRIDAIRAELAGTAGAVVEPLLATDLKRARVAVAWLDAAGQARAAADAALDLQAGASATAALAVPPAGAAALRVGLEPPPGQVFVAVRVGGIELSAAQALMGAFRTFTPAPAAASTLDIVAETAPLFGTAPGLAVTATLRIEPAGTGVTVTASVGSVQPLPARGDCTSLLAGALLLKTSTGDTLRTLALAVLCGWFKGTLGQAPCSAPPVPRDGGDPADAARALLAWTICRLAWRALFGIDPAAGHPAALERCLQQLFKAWCEGFHYKGPRCDCQAHGIVLGRVQLSAKGRILCFDEWLHRRHVLTGPLLTHWAGQFGLAPLDRSVARLARWICCVANAPLLAAPDGVAQEQAAVLALAGGAVVAGPAYAPNDRIGTATVEQVEQVGELEFVGQVLEMMLSSDAGGPLATAARLRALAVPGGSLQLLRTLAPAGNTGSSAPPAAPSGQVEALMAQVSPQAQALPPMARLPLRDFVAAYADAVTLAQVKPRAGAALFEPMVAALESAGVVTLADLALLGPEPALARAHAQLARHEALAEPRSAEKAMALVYDSALKTLASAGDAIADRARHSDELEPFTRADLDDSTTLSALRKATNAHLRDRGLSSDALKRIAARAMAMRPQ